MKSLKSSILFFLLVSFCFARTIDEIKDSGQIIFAVYENFPPYSYKQNDTPKGIDIDIAKQIAKSLNVKPVWYFSGFDETLSDDLRNNIWKGNLIHKTKADVMMRVPYDYEYMRLTDKQTGSLETEMVSIKGSYHCEKWVIATNKKAIPEYKTLAIFAYHKIGVEIDTLPDLHLSSFGRGIIRQNVIHYTDIQKAVKDFKEGKIDAIAGLKSQLEFLLDFKHNQNRYSISDDIPLMKSKWDLATAVSVDSKELSYHIDLLIEKLFKNGNIKKTFDNYGVNYIPPISKSQ